MSSGCTFPRCTGYFNCYHMSWSNEERQKEIERKRIESARFLDNLYKERPHLFVNCSNCGKYQLNGNHCTHCE
jgi:NAD dependent epimerase/dehydratase family enzyme